MKCKKIICNCTHTNGCVGGFIETRYRVVDTFIRNGEKVSIEKWYDGVRFCPTCDPERAYIQDTSKSSEELAERLQNRSTIKQTQTYLKLS